MLGADWCSASVAHLSCETQYGEMSQALNRTGRPIAFYMSCGGGGRAKSWSKDVANVWRIGESQTLVCLSNCQSSACGCLERGYASQLTARY